MRAGPRRSRDVSESSRIGPSRQTGSAPRSHPPHSRMRHGIPSQQPRNHLCCQDFGPQRMEQYRQHLRLLTYPHGAEPQGPRLVEDHRRQTGHAPTRAQPPAVARQQPRLRHQRRSRDTCPYVNSRADHPADSLRARGGSGRRLLPAQWPGRVGGGVSARRVTARTSRRNKGVGRVVVRRPPCGVRGAAGVGVRVRDRATARAEGGPGRRRRGHTRDGAGALREEWPVAGVRPAARRRPRPASRGVTPAPARSPPGVRAPGDRRRARRRA
jgi:hypothetical protein